MPLATLSLIAGACTLSACGGGDAGDLSASVASASTPDAQALARRTGSTGTTSGTTLTNLASSVPADFVKCADEWTQTTCNFSGSTLMYYGATGAYTYKTVSGPFNCNTGNTIFGDPAPGVAKACWIAQTVASSGSGSTSGTTSGTTSGSTTGTTTGSTTGSTSPTSGASTLSFSASSQDLPNPDRGFYGWSGSDFINSYDPNSVQSAYNAGQRLVFAKVQLDAWRTTDLPATFLSSLGSRLGQVRSAGMKAVLLFNYDFSAGGRDATAAQIERHLQQLQPVLAANADVLPYMRAGFVGAWGEWHSSQSGNSCGYNSGTTTCATADANRARVRNALLTYVPATTQIAFRYPADLMKWYPDPHGTGRAGMHNDCFLAGPSDSGTYSSTTQRSYVQALSSQAAFGGETCNNAELPLRNTCADILREGPAYHVAWLNSSDWAGFITAWRNGGCLSQVSNTMGYRLSLDQVSAAPAVTRGQSLSVGVDLRNVGWAPVFGPRRLVVTLRHRSTGALLSVKGPELRTLPSQATASTRWAVDLAVPAAAATGAYDLLLSAPDGFATTAADPRFALRWANADNATLNQAWESASAQFRTGVVVQVQ